MSEVKKEKQKKEIKKTNELSEVNDKEIKENEENEDINPVALLSKDLLEQINSLEEIDLVNFGEKKVKQLIAYT
jgi:hypothetical protein